MAIDLHNIKIDYDALEAAMAEKRYKAAYNLALRIINTYQNSDCDQIWMVNEEVDDTYRIKEKLEKKYPNFIDRPLD